MLGMTFMVTWLKMNTMEVIVMVICVEADSTTFIMMAMSRPLSWACPVRQSRSQMIIVSPVEAIDRGCYG